MSGFGQCEIIINIVKNSLIKAKKKKKKKKKKISEGFNVLIM